MYSTSDHAWMYDVFISFRGNDTRNNFVSHLYATLIHSGIRTFIDNEELRKGKELGPELERAIEGSTISIVVLSQYYADSKWCLNELVHIMDCHKINGQLVIPIFYHVDPSDVRNLRGAFGEGFYFSANKIFSHFGVQREEVLVPKWKRALTQVVDLSGWDANNFR